MTSRVNIKVEQIARLRVAGLKDERICQIFNLSRGGLSRILALPEYIQEETAILEGTLSKMDEALAGRSEEMKRSFQVGVPAAMRALLETVTQRRDLRARMAAAKEILDRDPDRTFVKQDDQGQYNRPDIPDGMMNAVAEQADKVIPALVKKESELVQ